MKTNPAREALSRAVNRAIANGAPVYTEVTAHTAFLIADGDWHRELERLFGRFDAGQARYEPRGRGVPGSTLRAVYERRAAAQRAWADANHLNRSPA